MGSIYKITSPNKKVYIGQTSRDPQKRWRAHLKCARHLQRRTLSGTAQTVKFCHSCLYKAMIKHGIENFTFEVIESGISLDLLDEREIALIKQYDSIAPNGLNLQSGGGGFRHHPDTKKLMSEKAKITVAKIIDDRRREETKGLPMYIIYYHDYKDTGYCVRRHPQCSFKTFVIAKLGTLENCKNAAIEFLTTLESTSSIYKPQKADPHLPKGITRQGDGFLAKRKTNGILYKKSFTGKNIPEDEKLQNAIQFLNKIPTIVKEEGSETKCLSAIRCVLTHIRSLKI